MPRATFRRSRAGTAACATSSNRYSAPGTTGPAIPGACTARISPRRGKTKKQRKGLSKTVRQPLFHFSETAGINHNRTLFLRETVPVIGHIPRFQEFIFTQVQRGQPVIATIQLSQNRISRKIQRSQLVVITPQRFQHRIMRHIKRRTQIFNARQTKKLPAVGYI